jgi:threo-3-hydroxy-L-aspartate ammonia-lyase
MTITLPTVEDLRKAEPILRRHISPAPLIRSYALERALGLPRERRVWLKDYGWTPVGSFKLMGALCWMDHHQQELGDRPVAAHSSGNFASGIAFAGQRYGKRVLVVMPESAPRIKFERTRSFGAEVRTYDITRDHITGDRARMARELVEQEGALAASPYDDPHVIAGNGVGGLEIVEELKRNGRSLATLVCAVSGGGLLAGHALAIADGFPDARIVAVEPDEADDFRRSLASGRRERLERPRSICDGLLSYDVGEYNWPILQRHVRTAVTVADDRTRDAMRWMYEQHGLRTEPSGVIGVAALRDGHVPLDGEGDIVVILSGRNIDDEQFRSWIAP